MKLKTRIKAGSRKLAANHNVAVKTGVKAGRGRIALNHNPTVR
jgi:hypothetical protein